MRVFLLPLLFVFLFNSGAFAQAEIARQRFDQGLTNAERGRFEQALKDFQNALEKYKFAPDSSDELAAKINYNIGVCFYHLGGLNDAVARSEAAIKLSENKYGQAFHALGIAEGEIGNREAA